MDAPPRLPLVRPLWWLSYILARAFWLAPRYRFRISGHENLPDAPVVVAAKHVRSVDIPVVAAAVRAGYGCYPFFEMASFEGYGLLERMIPWLRRIGGFPVMRPKDVVRLKKKFGYDKETATARMRETNGRAARTREAILRAGHALCFFPEGTRDRETVSQLRARHEVEEAIAIAPEVPGLHVLPVSLSYAPPKKGIPYLVRGRVDVEILEPIPLDGADLDEAMAAVHDALRRTWRPEKEVSG